MATFSTSHYANKIFKKQGFELLRENAKRPSQNMYKVEGEFVFPPPEPLHHFSILMKKLLQFVLPMYFLHASIHYSFYDDAIDIYKHIHISPHCFSL